MPKKFKGENSKASEARAKKEQKKVEEHEKKQKALEDEYWRDDDKHVMRKQQRKDDRDRKRTEQLENKREKDALLAEEMASIKSAKPASAKVTRAQIDSHREREAAAAAAAAKKTSETPVTDMPLEENVNQLSIEEGARSVDDALTMLSGGRSTEKHPEKRLKAAYAAFEEKNLPILKAENPNFRLSQLKQMLKKDWMKSPENPMNQRIAAFNTK